MPEAEVFISYSHRDNESPFEGEPGWVKAFHHALEVCLGNHLGRKPMVWRDPRIPGNVDFSQELVKQLTSAKALVCIVSKHYQSSPWCAREFDEFPRRSGASRIFKVLKMPVPLEEQRKEIQPHIGYQFYRVDRERDTAVALDPSIDRSVRAEYWVKLNELAQDMSSLLSEEDGAAGPDDRGGPDAGKKVFLADTTFDLKREHGDIKRDLERHGYDVLPGRNLPLVANELQELVQESLAGCALSVHLIGGNYGIVPEGSADSLVALQNHLAVERSEQGAFHRLIWLGGASGSTDERQLSFVAELKDDNRNHVQADVLAGSFEELKTMIYQRLEPKVVSPSSENGAGDLTRVYVICDQVDLEQTPPLEDYLYGKGLEVVTSAFGGGPEELRLDHQETLASSDAVLIYYGFGNELWLRRKLRELEKSAGYGRKRSLLAAGVFVAPPLTPQKERLRLRQVLVLTQGERLDPEALDPFLNKIEDGRTSLAG